MKIIVDVGYYELKVRPAKKGEKGQYLIGAGGLFTKHTTCFNSLRTFENHIRNKFEDSTMYSCELEKEFCTIYPYIDGIKYTNDKQYFYV